MGGCGCGGGSGNRVMFFCFLGGGEGERPVRSMRHIVGER